MSADRPVVYYVRGVRCPSDYEDILLHGLVRKKDNGSGRLVYMRTGPYVPPVCGTVGFLIATAPFIAAYEASGLTGIVEFRPVELARIVRVDWRGWTEDTFRFPEDLGLGDNNSPEDYVLKGSSDVDLLRTWRERIFEVVSVDCGGKGVPVDVNFFSPVRDLTFADAAGAAFVRRLFADTLVANEMVAPNVFYLSR